MKHSLLYGCLAPAMIAGLAIGISGCGEEASQSPAPPPAAAAPPPAEKGNAAKAKNSGSSAAKDSALNGTAS